MNNELALPVDVGDSVVISGAENTLCKHEKQTVKWGTEIGTMLANPFLI